MSFDELTKDIPKSLKVRTYSSPKMNYSISHLNRFKFVDKEYNDTLSFELFVDTTMVFEQGASLFSVVKYNYTEATLERAWDKLISNRIMIEDFRIYSQGITDFLPNQAFYEHSACTISGKNTESISFLFRGDSSSFFGINIQVITDENYPYNIHELLYCVKSMKCW